MYHERPEWIAEQERRWLRPDGDRYLRHDAERYMKPAPFDHEAFIAEWRAKKSAEVISAHEAINPLSDPGVRRLLAELKFELLLWQLRRKYRPDQPRVPAGNPDGGQWTSSGGQGTKPGDDAEPRLVLSDVNPDEPVLGAQYAELNRPGIGHNQPPIDVPERRPPTPQERHRIAREVARHPGWIAESSQRGNGCGSWGLPLTLTMTRRRLSKNCRRPQRRNLSRGTIITTLSCRLRGTKRG